MKQETWDCILQVRVLDPRSAGFRDILQRVLDARCFWQAAILHRNRRELLRRNIGRSTRPPANDGELDGLGCHYGDGGGATRKIREREEPEPDFCGLDRDVLLEMIEAERPELYADELDALDDDALIRLIVGEADTRESEGYGWTPSDDERTDEYTTTYGELWQHAGTALLTVIKEAPDEVFRDSEPALHWMATARDENGKRRCLVHWRDLEGCEHSEIVYAYLRNELRHEIERLWLDGATLDQHLDETYMQKGGPSNKLTGWQIRYVSLDAPVGLASDDIDIDGDSDIVNIGEVVGFEDSANPRHGDREINLDDVEAAMDAEDFDFACAQYGDGAELAERYEISKAAVWKRTQRARRKGAAQTRDSEKARLYG